MVILDSLEWNKINKTENYKALHRVDFDNPLLLTSDRYPITLNRIQYARPVSRQKYKGLLDENGGYVSSLENAEKIISNSIQALKDYFQWKYGLAGVNGKRPQWFHGATLLL